MKKIYITLALCLLAKTAYMQKFLDSNTVWIEYVINTETHIVESKQQLSIQEDTLLHDTLYYKLMSRSDTFFEGGIRESEGKIFADLTYYDPQGIDDMLLYDFTTKIGDTIQSKASEGILSRSPVITDIDTIELENNEKRKLFSLNGGEDIWIEGIGSIFGFLFPAFDYLTNYTTPHLVCFKQNEVIYYRNDTLCSNDCCTLLTNIHKVRNQKLNVRGYPNPTSGKVTIKLPDGNDNKALILTDITGIKKWEKKQLSDNSYKLDLSYFDNGIYILTVKGKNYENNYKIIKY